MTMSALMLSVLLTKPLLFSVLTSMTYALRLSTINQSDGKIPNDEINEIFS